MYVCMDEDGGVCVCVCVYFDEGVVELDKVCVVGGRSTAPGIAPGLYRTAPGIAPGL